jgi:hypothetical protein
LAPFAKAVDLLCTIPGIARRTAEVIIAETGGDMSASPIPGHVALLGGPRLWAGMCPGNVRRQTPRRQRLEVPRATLTEAIKCASRTRDAYLVAQYQRLRVHRRARKATTAVAHPMLIAWHMLQTGETYTDPGGDYFARRDPERTTAASSLSWNAADTPSPCTRPRPDQTTNSLQMMGHFPDSDRSLDRSARGSRRALRMRAAARGHATKGTGKSS